MSETEERALIVTGGSGALGSAIVEAALAAGWRVTVPWIDERQAVRLRDRFAECLAAGRLTLLKEDVAEEEAARNVARAAGAVAGLVNGVGGFDGGPPVQDTPLEVWDRLYRMNVRTAVAMSRAVLPGMLERRRGALVNVAAAAVHDPPAGLAAYVASKAGVAALTRALHQEVSPHGLRVNAVLPTTIDTPANRAAMPDADPSAWTPPGAIADTVLWLLGEDASAVSGALIPV